MDIVVWLRSLGVEVCRWRERTEAATTSDPRAGVDTEARARVQVHIRSADIPGAARVGARIPQAAHIREAAAGNRLPHSANICGHMDRDGNPADKDTAQMRRTRSAPARREARRCSCKCGRTLKQASSDYSAPSMKIKKRN
jgi:hypothetical protein